MKAIRQVKALEEFLCFHHYLRPHYTGLKLFRLSNFLNKGLLLFHLLINFQHTTDKSFQYQINLFLWSKVNFKYIQLLIGALWYLLMSCFIDNVIFLHYRSKDPFWFLTKTVLINSLNLSFCNILTWFFAIWV